MGTNYYTKLDGEELHIGKSSGGWCFSLHVIPELDINDLPDWIDFLKLNKLEIKNEYGEIISLENMMSIITDRKWKTDFTQPISGSNYYKSWDEFHERNYSEPGPNGLLRHKIGYHCIKQGAGTWDCIIGVFS